MLAVAIPVYLSLWMQPVQVYKFSQGLQGMQAQLGSLMYYQGMNLRMLIESLQKRQWMTSLYVCVNILTGKQPSAQ